MSPVNVSSIGAYIREQREKAETSIRQLAQAAGVPDPYLSQVERGLRRPTAEILQQIARALRISAEALYVQAGILDDKSSDSSVTDAIMADQEITERQKRMLIDIYESFRKEVRADRAAAATPADAGPGAAAQAGPGARTGAAAKGEAEGTDPVTEAYEESGHDPLAPAVAAAEAEPWTDPPTAHSR